MIPVRQSTAFEIAIGPVLDADGVAVTNCVVGDFKIKKTTGNFAALNGSATLTHVSAGVYDLVLTTSDLDTVGLATIAIDDTVNACASLYLQVIEEAVYDRDFAASTTGYVANQPVDVNTIKTQSVTCAAGVTVLASVGTAATSTAQSADNNTLLTTIAGYLDTEIAGLVTDMATVLSRLSATRAGYLDKLNISGNVAASSEVTSIQNNTTTSLIAPANILRPASGTLTAKIVVYLTDEIGNMEAPDSAPTLSVFDAAGTDLTARLASPTGTLVSTGVYTWDYTSSSTDEAEEILFTVTVIEGGATRYKGVTSWITDNATTDFTSSDRADLLLIKGYVDELESRLTALRAGYLDNLASGGAGLNDIPWNSDWDAEVQSEVTDAINAYDPPTNAEMEARTVLAASYATAANQTTILTNLATANVALAKFTTMTVLDGAVYQFTANALELGPGGGDVEVDSFSNAALNQLSALREINAHGAVVREGEIDEIIIGDDYLTANGRQLQFVNAAGSWPNLSSATVTLILLAPIGGDDEDVEVSGTVITASGANQRIDVELTHDVTGGLTVNYKNYRLKAEFVGGVIVRLEEGVVSVSV